MIITLQIFSSIIDDFKDIQIGGYIEAYLIIKFSFLFNYSITVKLFFFKREEKVPGSSVKPRNFDLLTDDFINQKFLDSTSCPGIFFIQLKRYYQCNIISSQSNSLCEVNKDAVFFSLFYGVSVSCGFILLSYIHDISDVST